MSLFSSILVPLDGSAIATRSLPCATWLASRLGTRLHILSATSRELPARAELRRLHVAEEHWPLVELHQAPAYPENAILAAIDQYNAGLVVMSARGAAGEGHLKPSADLLKVIGHVTEAVIRQCPVPVLLLPPSYRELLPWTRVLVPVSGETESDQALALAVRFGNALDLAVYAAHVADAEDEELAVRTRYSDALHHEYAAQLDELVARALPTLAPNECRCIQGMALGHGDVASELIHLMKRERVSALVVGWHGHYGSGRAEVLKKLLPVLDTPVLLVKSARPSPFRLKVGEEIE